MSEGTTMDTGVALCDRGDFIAQPAPCPDSQVYKQLRAPAGPGRQLSGVKKSLYHRLPQDSFYGRRSLIQRAHHGCAERSS